MAERFELGVALQRTEKDGLSRLSFGEWREHAAACAARLIEAGVRPGDRVLVTEGPLGGSKIPSAAPVVITSRV